MSKEISYNRVPLDTTNGLNKVVISHGDYILMEQAPASANVKIRLGSTQADPIEMKANFSIECRHVDKVYLSCDAVVGGEIVLYVSKNDSFKMNRPASDLSIESIGEMGTTALQQFKNLMPSKYEYLETISTNKIGTGISNTQNAYVGLIFNDCDKVVIKMTVGQSWAYTAGLEVHTYGTLGQRKIPAKTMFQRQNHDPYIVVFENIRGESLSLNCAGDNTALFSVSIDKYTLQA